MILTLEVDGETDGRFIAEVRDLPGVLAYSVAEQEAVAFFARKSAWRSARRSRDASHPKATRNGVLTHLFPRSAISACFGIFMTKSPHTHFEIHGHVATVSLRAASDRQNLRGIRDPLHVAGHRQAT